MQEKDGKICSSFNDIIKATSEYYTEKINSHGASNLGVDWNSEASQRLRYDQLSKILPLNGQPFSVCDYGCGYGYYRKYLDEHKFQARYIGIDISQAMIDEACRIYKNRPDASFLLSSDIPEQVDFAVASGIFNVKNETPISTWEKYVFRIIDELNAKTRYGFSFNCLTKYSDADHMKDYLYYPDPCLYFDYCKRNFSRNVALLHDYELYEFTILVRKQPAAGERS